MCCVFLCSQTLTLIGIKSPARLPRIAPFHLFLLAIQRLHLPFLILFRTEWGTGFSLILLLDPEDLAARVLAA
jgi:hypothetical protein